MEVTVLSGKGGTGKTTVSTNLALALDNLQFFDADVEEPIPIYLLNLISLINQSLCCVKFPRLTEKNVLRVGLV
jgi:MinD superfamily P-loop ATPase